jgi:hypothetical protein
MKKILIILVFSQLACESQEKKADSFLDRFIEINEFPTSVFYLKNKIIKQNDTIENTVLATKFLIPSNEIKYSNNFVLNKYHYYGKYKLNENYYLIAYKKFYDYHESKIILSIYDIKNELVTSSIEIFSSDLFVSRNSYYEKGILYIESHYKKIPNGLDAPKEKEYINKSMIEGYRINKNYIFENIK